MPDIQNTPYTTPIPVPTHRSSGGQIGDNGTYPAPPATPKVYSQDLATGAITIGTGSTSVIVQENQQDGLATQIEKVWYVNLANPEGSVDGFEVPATEAVTGPPAIPAQGALKVDIIEGPTDNLVGITIEQTAVKVQALTPGEALSVAGLIRSKGIGTVYAPPAP